MSALVQERTSRSAVQRLLSVVVALAVVGAATPPPQLYAQDAAHWKVQLGAYAGWLFPSGDVAQLADGNGSATSVQVSSTFALSGRALFPLVDQPKGMLGRVSLGVYGLVAPSADMTTGASQSPIGRSHYYQAAGLLSAGHFIPATPLNITLTGMLGAGVGHRVLEPNAGVSLAGEDDSHTTFMLVAAVGLDVFVHSRFSLLAEGGVNLGIEGRDGAERSVPVLIGLGVRF